MTMEEHQWFRDVCGHLSRQTLQTPDYPPNRATLIMSAKSPNPSATPAKRWYVITCLVALLVFALLAALVLNVPIVSEWDALASNWAQSLRSPGLDQLMLAVTLSGDTFVALSGAFVILIYLFYARHWKLFFLVLSIAASTTGLVFLLKTLTARDRPSILSSGLDTFSFPSGHATTAAVIAGVVALLIARGRHLNIRRGVYVVAALFTVMVGISRVYLQVHWPTDILAGWMLGYMLVALFAWHLQSDKTLTTHRLTPLILSIASLTYIAHVFLTWTSKADKYGVLLS